jgi:hypothetical protein
MREGRGFSSLLVPLLLTVVSVGVQPPASSFEGVWKRVEESYAAPDTSWAIREPQPSLYIFTKRHYSMMYVLGARPRTLFAGPGPTGAEKVAAYDRFRASAGTYELRGPLLIIHPVVARSPDYMAVKADTARYRLRGDTLLLTVRYAWGRDKAKRVEDIITLLRVY